MSFLAANLAGFPDLSPCLVERAIAGLSTGNGGGELLPSCGGHAYSYPTAMAGELPQPMCRRRLLEQVFRYVSRLLLGHSFGVSPAPSGTRSSASRCAPLWGHGSSHNKFENRGKEGRANFFRAPPRKQTFGTWERDPLARLRPV
jgi:hypothetical protein